MGTGIETNQLNAQIRLTDNKILQYRKSTASPQLFEFSEYSLQVVMQ